MILRAPATRGNSCQLDLHCANLELLCICEEGDAAEFMGARAGAFVGLPSQRLFFTARCRDQSIFALTQSNPLYVPQLAPPTVPVPLAANGNQSPTPPVPACDCEM